MTETPYRYIVVDETGDAFVEGTKIPVAQLMLTLEFGKRASESDIERICAMYPKGYLTGEKVRAVLDYFQEDPERVMRYLNPEIPEGFEKDQLGNWVRRNE